MPKDVPEIVAHRGASSDCPENTIAAFNEAWRQGADAIEGDFRLTADGRIVCLHDKTLKRTTGDRTSVDAITLAEVRELDAGLWKDVRFKGERVPTIDEVLAVVAPSKRIFIEVKTGPEMVIPLLAAINRSEIAQEQVVVIAFDAEVIRALKKERPGVRAFWLSTFKEKASGFEPSIDELIATARDVRADGLGVKALPEVVTRDFVEEARGVGLEVHVWTVDDPNVARQLCAAGVRSITTNRPEFLRTSMGPEGP